MESSIRPAFPPELQERLRYYISERSGLYFKDHDLKGLEGALLNRMASLGIDSALAYYTRLTSVEDREAELRELLNLLTVNHTYFLRNDAQFKALKQIILPEIIERKRRSCRSGDRPSLRIWSAGCSTGEEPYSIAMILDEVLTDPEVWDIQIIATDASTEALSRAGRGLYNRNSVKTVEPARLEKYFTEEIGPYREPAYRINDFLKKRVAFGFHNLMGEEFPVQLDVIFCRNVVIYFEFETTLKIMNRLHASLADEGYLAIGYSETLHYLSDKFRMVCWEEAIYYRKTAPGTVTAAVEATPAASDNQIDRILEALSREQVSMEIRTATAQQEPLAQNIREVLVEAAKCFHAKQYDRALALAQQAAAADGSAAEPYYLAAEIHINRGRFAAARQQLETFLKKNPFAAAAHYLLGCIGIEEGGFDGAQESLKKALYLEKDFPMAYFRLGNLYKVQRRPSEAIRQYRNALKALSASAYADIIPYSGGFDAATLLSVCRDNIERLKLEG